MAGVAEIWRHPIKSHGREAIDAIDATAGEALPWDRHWAVTHEATKFDKDDPQWVMCRNFMIGAATPGVAGIWSKLDEATGHLTLSHSALPDITIDPTNAADIARFITWVTPLCPPDKRQPTGIASAGKVSLSDTSYQSVSIMTRASHAAVEAQLGQSISPYRWRGNIWLDGPKAWEELDWVGRDVQIGTAVFTIAEPIERCVATAANPKTGHRDVDLLSTLRDGWDHQQFGVYATVKTSGRIAVGDTYKVL